MRPIYKTYTTTGAKEAIPLDLHRNPFNVSVFLNLVDASTATATLEYTGDNVQDPAYVAANGKWWPHPDMTGSTADDEAVITKPVTAVRLNIAAISGSVQLQIIQAGS